MWEFIVWFSLFFIAMIVAGRFLGSFIIALFNKSTEQKSKEFKTVITTKAIPMGDYDGEVGKTILNFVAETEESNYIAKRSSSWLVAKALIEKLENYYAIRIVSQICSIDGDSCTTKYHLVGQGGNQIVLHAQTRKCNTKIGNVYQFEEGIWEDYTVDDVVEITTACDFAYSASVDVDHEDVQALLSIIDECKVEEKVREFSAKEQRKVVMKTITYGKYGFSIGNKRVDLKKLTPAQLDAFYSPIPITYQGEKHNILPSSASTLAVTALSGGKNVFLQGEQGVGKTTMALDILSAMVNEEHSCYWVTPAAMVDLMTSEGIEFLQSRFGYQEEFADDGEAPKPKKVILFVDEAEGLLKSDGNIHTEQATFFLDLLDGGLKATLDISCCLIFNCAPGELNPRLFRSGRGMMLPMGLLNEQQAAKAVHHLKLSSQKDKIFDADQFKAFLSQDSVMTDGTTAYAPPGFTTLADIILCFRSKEQNDFLLEAIRKAANPGKYEKPAPATIQMPKMKPAESSGIETEAVPQEAPPVAKINNWKKKKNKNKNRNR